jgi:hypothetical protein
VERMSSAAVARLVGEQLPRKDISWQHDEGVGSHVTEHQTQLPKASRTQMDHVRRGPAMAPLLANLLSDPLPATHSMSRPNMAGQSSPNSFVNQSISPPGQESVPTSRESASYARRRAGTACFVCRSRKTKCDNQRPVCGFCRATGGACGYPDDAPSDHSKLDRGSLAILQRLGEMERNITALLSRNELNNGNATDQPGPQQQGSSATQPLSYTPDVTMSDESQPGSDRPPAADVVTRSSEMRVESLLHWPVFDIHHHPSLTSSLGHEGGSLATATGEGLFDLDPEVITQLVENFLATNHLKNPIFVVDQLWARVRDIAETGLRWDGTTCLVVSEVPCQLAELRHTDPRSFSYAPLVFFLLRSRRSPNLGIRGGWTVFNARSSTSRWPNAGLACCTTATPFSQCSVVS